MGSDKKYFRSPEENQVFSHSRKKEPRELERKLKEPNMRSTKNKK